MFVCLIKREKKDCVCVCVSRPQVSGHSVRVLRGLLRGPPPTLSLASVFGGREQQKRGGEVDEGYQHIAPRGMGACRGGGAVTDKQVPMLIVRLHT